MDRNAELKAIVKRVLTEIAEMTPSRDAVKTELICDDATGHYQLGQVGWDGSERVDDVYLHVDVADDKVWIQHDGTNLRLADRFTSEGISKERIVLAFHCPSLRSFTDFAVA